MDRGIGRLLLYQCVLVAAVSAVLLVKYNLFAAGSCGYGGGIAGANALLAARCARRDARAPERTPQQSLTAVFLCVAHRFLIVALLFAFGLGALGLEPIALLAGFVAGQLVLVIIGTQQLTQN
ncbi:MAG: ATP synthase subunit I [Thiogranum sp.]